MNPSSPEPSGTAPLSFHAKLRKRLALFWGDLHLFWKLLMIAAVLPMLGLPFYRPAMRALKHRNYETDLASAKRALAEGRSVEALDLSLDVLRNHPQKTDALPIFMRAADGAADSRLPGVAQAYLSQNTQDKSERVFAWKVLSKQSPMGIAGILWLDKIRSDERADPDFLIPWLERQLGEGLFQDVAQQTATFELLADPRLTRLRLLALARQGAGESRRECQTLLFRHLASHPGDGPLLLPVIDEIPQSELLPTSFTAATAWLKAHGGELSADDQMRLARCEIAAHPESTDAVLKRMADTYAAPQPVAVARLYSTLQRFDKAEELLEPALPKGDPGAFKSMAEVLERSGKLEKWNKLLEHPPAGVSQPEVLCDRAFIAGKQGDKRAETEFEQAAVAAAELRTQSDSLILLARHASRRGMDAYAKDVWIKAITGRPSSPLPFFAEISPVVGALARDRMDAVLFNVLKVYQSAEQGNLEVLMQYHYLGMLNGAVPPAQVLEVLELVREKFGSFHLDCTLAFAHLLEGDYQKAAELTGDPDIDWFEQFRTFRAIRAIALTKTGRKEEADIYMEDFEWDSLLPSETRVFRELLEPPQESDGRNEAQNTEKKEKAKLAEEARQLQKARERKEIRDALEAREALEAMAAGKDEETLKAEKAERAEKARLAEEARQAKRTGELRAIREKLAARTAKEAEEAKKNEKTEPADPR